MNGVWLNEKWNVLKWLWNESLTWILFHWVYYLFFVSCAYDAKWLENVLGQL